MLQSYHHNITAVWDDKCKYWVTALLCVARKSYPGTADIIDSRGIIITAGAQPSLDHQSIEAPLPLSPEWHLLSWRYKPTARKANRAEARLLWTPTPLSPPLGGRSCEAPQMLWGWRTVSLQILVQKWVLCISKVTSGFPILNCQYLIQL